MEGREKENPHSGEHCSLYKNHPLHASQLSGRTFEFYQKNKKIDTLPTKKHLITEVAVVIFFYFS